METTQETLPTKKELEELELTLKRLEVQERQRQLDYLQNEKAKDDQDRLNLEKLNVLNYMLSTSMIDAERTVVGGEPFMRPVYSQREEEVMRRKVIEIVKRL